MRGLLKIFIIIVLCGLLSHVIFKRLREYRPRVRSGRTRTTSNRAQGRKVAPSEQELQNIKRSELAIIEEIILGKWEGFLTGDNSFLSHELEVKKEGDELKAYGKIFVGLTAQQLTDIEDKNYHLVKPLTQLTYVASQEYDISLEDNRLTLTGVEASIDYTNNFRYYSVPYSLDTFSGKLYLPGLYFGETHDEAGSKGSFYFAKEEALDDPPPLELVKGETYQITCMFDERYHYSCYVPKNYDPATPTPLLINDNPNRNALPLSPKMADEFGWIMVGLTESSNRALPKICNENCAAVIMDLRRRFNIHLERIYFSGMSGGARRATQRGIYHAPNCAGLICIGAGFSFFYDGARAGQPLLSPVEQPIFFIVGQNDMNYREVVKETYPNEIWRKRAVNLVVHPGGHTWGRSEDHEAAIRWLDEQWKKSHSARPEKMP